MRYGMVKAAAVTPEIRVGRPAYNADAVIARVKELARLGVEIAVFPELCITGYTAMDLFFTKELLSAAVDAVKKVAAAVPDGMIVFVGTPISACGRLYNCAAALCGGRVIGLVPKHELPEYGEFYEKRYFTPAFDGVMEYAPLECPMGDILFVCDNYPDLVVGCEICEDMWADRSPSVDMCRAGATVIANLSASDEVVGKAEYRRLLVSSSSGKMHCAYIYADAGKGESTTDVVFSGHNIIAENGGVIAESAPFSAGLALTEIDVERLDVERRKTGMKMPEKRFEAVGFMLRADELTLTREIQKYPFVPTGVENTKARAELILTMQAQALAARMRASKSKTAVIGVSGGLDSTLALLVTCRAVDKKMIRPVTMPAFGTTEKTLSNAEALCKALGVELKTIDIKSVVAAHLKDIEHDERDVTYENAQARTRTMTLFDIANKTGGLVVGTGDLSELALGWATYNGDHMSSYGVNAGVPKTLVKYLVKYEGDRLGGDVKKAADAVLGTEITPELLPPENGRIAQKTEDILGKYDLIDFIMYYAVRYGFTREKIAYLLGAAFKGTKKSELDKALDTFYKRFDRAQFKRSCMPDGVKIGSVSFSPRSDFRLPSDLD